MKAFIENDHVILFETSFLLQFSETVINFLKDNSLANDKGEFSAHEIDFQKLKLDQVKAKAVLNLYFDKAEGPADLRSPISDQSIPVGAMELENISSQGQNDFKWSWKKITMFCVEYFFMKKPVWQYDEYLEMIHDAIRIFMPANFFNSLDKEQREVMVSRETEKMGIIEDSIDYTQKNNKYLPQDIRLTKIDF